MPDLACSRSFGVADELCSPRKGGMDEIWNALFLKSVALGAPVVDFPLAVEDSEKLVTVFVSVGSLVDRSSSGTHSLPPGSACAIGDLEDSVNVVIL